LVDPTPLKYQELEDFVSEGSCDPLGKLLTGNGRDAERWVLRRAPTDVEVEEIGSPRFRGLTADRERSGPVPRAVALLILLGNARSARSTRRPHLAREAKRSPPAIRSNPAQPDVAA
jgi:hypothetical protein